ncbi:MAG: hypothetical protein WC784_06605 [Candidatus Shapirobacteria bacterium]
MILKDAAAIDVAKNLDLYIDIPKIVSIIQLDDIDFGEIPFSGAVIEKTAILRSNHYSWSLSVYAERGELTLYNNETANYYEGMDTIPYIFTFNGSDPEPSQRIVSTGSLPTSPGDALIATFNRKTTGGKDGEPFLYSIIVPPSTSDANWDAGDYQEKLIMTITAN